jgi:hypothetical protein
MPHSFRFFTPLLAALLIGCAPKATFSVSVTNQTDRPITIGMVKEGKPDEPTWAPPEQLAIESPLDSLPPWGHVVPPGRTMDSPPVTGAFPQGSAAYLRVYAGEHSNAELLATSPSSPDRTDVLLFPGHNDVTVQSDDTGHLRATRARH